MSKLAYALSAAAFAAGIAIGAGAPVQAQTPQLAQFQMPSNLGGKEGEATRRNQEKLKKEKEAKEAEEKAAQENARKAAQNEKK